ncbi:hypothetical protein CAEBREN_18112 [Caenorhabditis brenneri]|uniref:SPK domain-containing protein n=1 Tax=Caenorhabditis brenneri TaxID=135651 RepID=G0NZJ8_CAEBE|nr:hypothetical protein CAEBREN_18112 [Caenorhabditis brenneri]
MAQQHTREEERDNLTDFLGDKCLTVQIPLNIKATILDYMQASGTPVTYGALRKMVEDYQKSLCRTLFFDTNTKVRQLYGLSVSVDRKTLKELREHAEVECDKKGRIIKYSARDGSLNLMGSHVKNYQTLKADRTQEAELDVSIAPPAPKRSRIEDLTDDTQAQSSTSANSQQSTSTSDNASRNRDSMQQIVDFDVVQQQMVKREIPEDVEQVPVVVEHVIIQDIKPAYILEQQHFIREQRMVTQRSVPLQQQRTQPQKMEPVLQRSVPVQHHQLPIRPHQVPLQQQQLQTQPQKVEPVLQRSVPVQQQQPMMQPQQVVPQRPVPLQQHHLPNQPHQVPQRRPQLQQHQLPPRPQQVPPQQRQLMMQPQKVEQVSQEEILPLNKHKKVLRYVKNMLKILNLEFPELETKVDRKIQLIESDQTRGTLNEQKLKMKDFENIIISSVNLGRAYVCDVCNEEFKSLREYIMLLNMGILNLHMTELDDLQKQLQRTMEDPGYFFKVVPVTKMRMLFQMIIEIVCGF